MKFIIIGKNIDVTPGLKDAVENKLGKLQRYFTPDTEIHVHSISALFLQGFVPLMY